METDNRKYTVLSFFVFSAICGYVLYLFLTQLAHWFKFGGSNVWGGFSWTVVGGSASAFLGFILFFGLLLHKRASQFIDEVFVELKKSTWPNSKDTSTSTLVVSVMVSLATLLFFIMDYIWGIVFRVIL